MMLVRANEPDSGTARCPSGAGGLDHLSLRDPLVHNSLLMQLSTASAHLLPCPRLLMRPGERDGNAACALTARALSLIPV